MAIALTLIHGPEFAATTKTYVFKAVLSSTYPDGGEVVDLSPYVSGNVSDLPISVIVEGALGYGANYIPGATIKLGTLKLWASAETQFTPGAYTAALLAATGIKITVVLPK